jgi:glycosyltransferase domain-containing protein
VKEPGTASIIIPTLSRPHYLKQLLAYFRGQRLAWPIIVADSSPSPEREANQKVINAAQDVLDLRYLPFDPGTPLYPEIVEALKVADSKYSIVCSDDDFALPEALRKCVEFLESNEDYVAASGWYMSLYAAEVRKPNRVRWRTAESSTPRSRLWAIRQTMPTFQSDDPSARFGGGAFTEDRAFFAVHRRDDQLRNMELTAKATTDFFFAEHLSFCLSLIQGKLKSLDTLHMVRRYQSHDEYDNHADPAVKPLHELLLLDDFSVRYSRFRDCIGRQLSNLTKMPIEDSGKLVDQAFLRYLSYYLNYHLAGSQKCRGRFKKVDQLIKILRIGWTAGSSAVVDRRLSDLLRSPYEFAITSALRKRSLQLDVFLKRFSCYREFEPIYDSLLT